MKSRTASRQATCPRSNRGLGPQRPHLFNELLSRLPLIVVAHRAKVCASPRFFGMSSTDRLVAHLSHTTQETSPHCCARDYLV